MAENENVQNPEAQQPQAQPEQDDQPVFQLQRCYLKDASLEMPHAPDILLTPQESAPQVDIQFEVSQRLVQADLYDITVRGTITVKAPEDKVIILAEVSPVSSRFTESLLNRCSTSLMCSARRWFIPIFVPIWRI